MLRYAYNNLIKQNNLKKLEWAVDLEVDHHGPTELHNPIIFMELGSSESNWTNKIGAAAVGDAIMGTINEFSRFLFTNLNIQSFLHGKKSIMKTLYEFIRENLKNLKTENITFAIGFGGPHYARNFSKIYDLPTTVYLSHIVPKYSVMKLTDDHIKTMINQTLEPINTAILDWKGLNSAEKKHILSLTSKYNLEIKKTKDYKL
jgi:D-tyrosyl-tRNA(Tyr) deacylase